jgi:hypothetical protein
LRYDKSAAVRLLAAALFVWFIFGDFHIPLLDLFYGMEQKIKNLYLQFEILASEWLHIDLST